MSFIGKWKDRIAHYIDLRLSLIKLGFVERTAGILSYLIYVFISLFLTIAILIFLGIGLGEWFATLVDSKAGGFLMTAGVFLLLMILLILLRAAIIRSFSGIFIRIMTEMDDEDEKEHRNRNEIRVD